MERRQFLTALGATIVPATGCLGGQPPEATDTPTGTPLPPGSVDFPDGPKDRPERPSPLTETAVREYVATHEYRYAYNSLWMNEHTDVTLDCRVDSVTDEPWGYEAVVTCTGYSNTNLPESPTGTPGVHADWFTQSFRYRVSETATHRERVEPRDPV